MAGRTPSPGGHGAADHSSAPAASARQGGGPGVRTAGFDGVAPRWSVGGAVRAQLRRDLTLALQQRGEALHPLIFFFMVCTLFPLRSEERRVGKECRARLLPDETTEKTTQGVMRR